MRQIEEDGLAPGALDLADDGARHDVARGQLAHGMVSLHETLARRVAQNRAFAAQRFRKQESRRARNVQRGGMELDELDVADLGAGAISRGDSIAGGDVGIGGVAEDAAQSAGGEQNRAGADHRQFAGRRVQHGGARDVAFANPAADRSSRRSCGTRCWQATPPSEPACARSRGRWNRRARAKRGCGCARPRARTTAWIPRDRTRRPSRSTPQRAPAPPPPERARPADSTARRRREECPARAARPRRLRPRPRRSRLARTPTTIRAGCSW